MRLPALEIQQPDLGRVLATVEAIKSSRTRNRLLQDKMEREKEVMAARAAALEPPRTTPAPSNALTAVPAPYADVTAPQGPGEPVPSIPPTTGQAAAPTGTAAPTNALMAPGPTTGQRPVAGQTAGGLSPAMRRYLAMDPQGGAQLIDVMTKIDDQRRARMKEQNTMIAQLLMGVESVPLEKRPAAYQLALQQAEQLGIPLDNVPRQYAPAWVQQNIKAVMAIDDQLAEMHRQRQADQPLSSPGKLAADLKAGRITQAQYDRAIEKPDNTLVEIGDPDSPTGTRWVKRSQAIGQPGKPGSGLDVEFGPDGRPIRMTTGRKGVGGAGGLGKRAQGAAQTEIITNMQAIDRINSLQTLYEPEFLTYKGAAKGAWATFLNKMDPDKRSQFQARRAAFISAANRDFLIFRKWATGVAGGEKEMAEIKRATFSEDDSPQDFEAKMGVAKSLYRRLNARLQSALKAGLDPVRNQNEFREFIKATPLDAVPDINTRGAELESKGYSVEQVTQILIDEGYITPKRAR